MEQKNECMLVTKESFQAVGLKWSGTFAEAGAGGIRLVQAELKGRINEIKHVVNPHILLGLSCHITEDAFTHYSAVEVEHVEDIPDGMVSISPPTLPMRSVSIAGDRALKLPITISTPGLKKRVID